MTGTDILERLRLTVAALLCVGSLTVFGVTLLIDVDAGWPVTIYPMFSDGRSHAALRTHRVFGVDARGEQRIFNENLRPLDFLRLTNGLMRMKPADRAEALRFVLKINPQFSAVRFYDEEWEAGGEKLLERTLLTEVSR